MKNGRNLLYLLMLVVIGLGAVMLLKKAPQSHGNTDDFFMKEDVQSYLKEFFIALPTKKFSVVHSGSNQAGTGYYLIGDLQTTNGKKMRVQISNNKKTIQSIEINDQRDF